MRRGRTSSASGPRPEEQFVEEQSLDPLAYRLHHLNQQGCSSSGGNRHDVDPFDIGSSESDVVEVDVVKMGAVDDVGWGANNNNIDSDYDYDDDFYQEGDGLFVDFGGRTPDQVKARWRQKEVLSTPRFGGGGSQSSHSRWENSTEHSRQSLSTISCKKNDVNDDSAGIDQHGHIPAESKSSMGISSQERSKQLVEQMIAPSPFPSPQRSVGKTSRRAPSISALSTLSSPTEFIALAEIPSKPTTQTVSNLVQVSIVTQTIETQEEECPRLEQLQHMTLEALESELMTIQAQTKTNLEYSWKAAERMRVENSELDKKAEGLKTKLDTAFLTSPPTRRHSDSFQSDDCDNESMKSVEWGESRRRQNRSIDDLPNARMESRSGSCFNSSRSMVDIKNTPWSEQEKDDISDVIDAYTVDLESPTVTVRQRNIRHVRHVENSNSNRSGISSDSGEFGFFCHDISESDMKPNASNNQVDLDQSDSSSDLNDVKSGVYYPPPNTDDDDESVSNPRQALGDNKTIIKVIETDCFGGNASHKPDFKRIPSLDGSIPSEGSSRGGLKRRMVRRPSFMGLFGRNESSKESEVSPSECLDESNYNQSTASTTESILSSNGNIFQVEARSIMIEELEKELIAKGDIVTDLIDKIEGQNEYIDNREVEISRLRAKINDEYNKLTCTQSTLQQSVKELVQWDSAIESRLNQIEGHIQRMKQKESDLRAALTSKELNEANCKIELEQKISRYKEEYNSIQEKSSVSLSKVVDSLGAINFDNNLEQSSKQLFVSLDMQTDKLHKLLLNSDRIATFIALKKHIEEQRERIIIASDNLFRVETDLRGNLIQFKLKEEGNDECTHTTESSLARERMSLERIFFESVLPHLVEARQEHARFVFAALTKVDEFLSWWDHLLAADSMLENCEQLGDAVNISSILEKVLADVTEDLAATQAKIDEEHDLFKRNLLAAGILDQQGCISEKLSTSKESNVESSDYQAELDNLNEQVSSLETSLSDRESVREKYASNIDQLHKQAGADSKANLELLDNIQEQVRILAKKLAMDDDQIASLRQSLREKKERIANLEYDEKKRGILRS